jgi:hypothetical protein
VSKKLRRHLTKIAVIREKYFEAKYTDRFTPNNVIGKLFPELTEEVSQKIEAPHLRITLERSDREVVPGSCVMSELPHIPFSDFQPTTQPTKSMSYMNFRVLWQSPRFCMLL